MNRKTAFTLLLTSLILGVIVALFYMLGYMPLSADEPIRTLIAADMQINGHFIAPELNGKVYLNKPPLYNWLLYGFFELFNSRSEFVVRLPSILSLLAFGYIVYKLSLQHLKDKTTSIIAAFAFVTGGNIWIYSGYLGHIDITYSLGAFLQIYVLYKFSLEDKWFKAFAISYVLAFAGFMMKGLPSVVFQGATVLAMGIITKQWKRIFSLQHVVSGFLFLIPLAGYLWLFSRHSSIDLLLQRILTESTSRTVTEKSLWESVSHLISFPFLYTMDVLPWGLGALLFFNKSIRTKILSNTFLKHCLILFGLNIIVYWLSPDYRARYVFMLMPLYLIPICYGLVEALKSSVKVVNVTTWILSIVLILSIGGMFAVAHNYGIERSIILAIVLMIIGFASVYLLSRTSVEAKPLYALIAVLIVTRIAYSHYMLPYRVATGPYGQEKNEAQAIANIVKDEPLSMYHSNVSLTMNWYITIERNQVLKTETQNFDLGSFYLVPTEVLKDTTNVETYFTFVRRYQSKDFSLVKFKNYFPDMPK